LDDEQGLKALLIDFGVASQIDMAVCGIGTFHFAHREIHFYKDESWMPHGDYDLTSLGFTMAALANNGVVGWTGFSDADVEDMFDLRRSVATKLLKDHGHSELCQEWIDYDETNYANSCAPMCKCVACLPGQLELKQRSLTTFFRRNLYAAFQTASALLVSISVRQIPGQLELKQRSSTTLFRRTSFSLFISF
jgi:hypothetical protein